jgi:isoleucyl-tRNA synthetase
LTVVDALFRACTTWLAPILSFTTDEAWTSRHGSGTCIHLEPFYAADPAWQDEALAARWDVIKRARRVVTGALEVERAAKRLGSSLEAAPIVYIGDPDTLATLESVPFDEIAIVSAVTLLAGDGPAEAFRLEGADGIAVVPARASGIKCARSWKYFDPATADPAFPGVTPRDAEALRERLAA